MRDLTSVKNENKNRDHIFLNTYFEIHNYFDQKANSDHCAPADILERVYQHLNEIIDIAISQIGKFHIERRQKFHSNLRSASSKTTTGLLPPSSKDTRFKLLLAAASMTMRPISTEPVNATF